MKEEEDALTSPAHAAHNSICPRGETHTIPSSDSSSSSPTSNSLRETTGYSQKDMILRRRRLSSSCIDLPLLHFLSVAPHSSKRPRMSRASLFSFSPPFLPTTTPFHFGSAGLWERGSFWDRDLWDGWKVFLCGKVPSHLFLPDLPVGALRWRKEA